MPQHKIPKESTDDNPILPHTIAIVPTAVPVFIGYTQKAQRLQVGDLLFTPTRISSLQEYEQYFGKKVSENFTISIRDELAKTGGTTSFISQSISKKTSFLRNNLFYHLQLFFGNGGGPCYIISVGKPKQQLNKRELKKGLDEAYQCAEPTLIVFPDGVNLFKATDLYQLYNEALAQANELGDRFVIMDISYNDLQGKSPVELFRSNIAGGELSKTLKYGAAYYPWLRTTIPYYYTDTYVKLIHETIIKETGKEDEKIKGEFDGLTLNNVKLNGTTIFSLIKSELDNDAITLAPSSAIAGIFALVDNTGGVWKAPANVALVNVTSPSIVMNNKDQESLKTDISGKSINAIRFFQGQGTLLWGARTLAGNDNEWRYISIRRFFSMIETSIKKSIQSLWLESNDQETWSSAKQAIEIFFMYLWRQGALAGAKPEHAFFVEIGLGQTMTTQDILEGKMIIEFGVAPARPAEFIIARMIQLMQQS